LCVCIALATCKHPSLIEKASATTKMDPNTSACSAICKDMASATALTPTAVRPMKDSGKEASRMARAHGSSLMGRGTKANGKTTVSMASARCSTKMGKKMFEG